MMFNKLIWNICTGFQEFFTFYKGGGGGGSSTTTNQLDPAVVPYVTYGLEEAKKLYQQPGPDYYPGQTYVDPSAQTTQALNLAQARATAGSPLVNAAQRQQQNVIQGNYLGANPFLNQAMSGAASAATQAYNDAIQNTRSGAAGSGRYGSAAMFDQTSRAQQNLANALAQEAGRLMYQNYGAERGYQQQAVQQAPAMAMADYADINQLALTGQTYEDYAKDKLNADIARFEYGQNLPYAKLESYLAGAYGAPTPMNQTTTQSGGGK